MNKKSCWFIKTLLVTISLLIATPAEASSFIDVDDSSAAAAAIQFVFDRQYVQGLPDGTFKPLQSLNRAELLKMVLLAKYPSEVAAFESETACFADVPVYDWSSRFICYAAFHQIINGYPDGQFRPWQPVTYAEALKIVFNTINGTKFPVTDPWYASYVDFANSENLNATEPSLFTSINRGQMAELLSKTVQLNERILAYDDYTPRRRHRYRSIAAEVIDEVNVTATDNESQTVNEPSTNSGSVFDSGGRLEELYAPNGYYTNVNGVRVPNPYLSSSLPPSATARCDDDYYSFSTHRSGTCQGHGGVRDWLVDLP